MARALEELELAPQYDEIVVNADRNVATDELVTLIERYETDERN